MLSVSMRAAFGAVVLCLLATVPAAAEFRILGSPGGQIGQYLNLFAMVRESGERVVIDGPCYSACTLVLSVVPRERICVTRKAVLGFHAAWTPGFGGQQRTHAEATRLMHETYPVSVRRWIDRNGGLTRKAIFLRGRDLYAMYRDCSPSSTRTAKATKTTRAKSARVASARANLRR